MSHTQTYQQQLELKDKQIAELTEQLETLKANSISLQLLENEKQALNSKLNNLTNWLKNAEKGQNNYQEAINAFSSFFRTLKGDLTKVTTNHYRLEENVAKSQKYAEELHELSQTYLDELKKIENQLEQYRKLAKEISTFGDKLTTFSNKSNETLQNNLSKYKSIITKTNKKEFITNIESVLDHPQLHKELMDYCEVRLCSENLLVLDEIHQYYMIKDKSKIETKGAEIMSKYISESSDHHVNIPHTIVQSLESLISQEKFHYTCDFFFNVEMKIKELLNDNVLPDFKGFMEYQEG